MGNFVRLDSLLQEFRREVFLLRNQWRHSDISQNGYWVDAVESGSAAYAVIRLHDAWSRFCRQLVLDSAQGDIITRTGLRVHRSPIVKPGQRALDALRSTYPLSQRNRRLWEPRWHEPAQALDAATRLQISNAATIQAGLGLTKVAPLPAFGNPDELRNCRNYLAHRSKLASDDLDNLRRRLGVTKRITPDELPRIRIPGGATLFEVWCIDLMTRASVATK